MDSKKKQNKNTMNINEADFKKYDAIADKIKDVMSRIDEEEKSIEIKGLDEKFIRNLEASGVIELEKLSQQLERKLQNKRARWFNFSSLPKGFMEYAIALSVFLLLLGSGAVAYLWPASDSNDTSVATTTPLESESSLQAVHMTPQTVTQSGYVDKDSSFLFELASELDSDPSQMISISPEVEVDYDVEEVDGKPILKVTPKESLNRDQNYMISMSSDSTFKDGSKLDNSMNWSVAIEPLFRILSTSPEGGAEQVPVDSQVEFLFNHKNILVESFKKYVTFKPPVPGEFVKEGKNIVFIPTPNFANDTQYTVTIDKAFSNTNGETLENGLEFTFKTGSQKNDTNLFDQSSFWQDNGGREIVSMSRGIITTAYVGEGEDIEYTLYSMPIGTLNNTVEQFIERETQLPPRAEKIEEKTLKNGEPFQYFPEEDGLYILVAKGELGSLQRLILVSDLSAVVTEQIGKFDGWVYDLPSGEVLKDYTVEIYNDSEKIDDGKLRQDSSFSARSGDFIVIKKDDQTALWMSDWSVNDISTDVVNIHRPGLSNSYSIADLLTDNIAYRQGDTVKYFSDLRDLRAGSIFPEQYEEVTVNVFSGSDQSLLLQSRNYDLNKTEGVLEGSYKIADDFKDNSLRIVLIGNGKQLAQQYKPVVENNYANWDVRVSVEDQNINAGETVIANIDTNRPGQTFYVSVYADQMDRRLFDTIYHSKKLYWGAESFVFREKIQTDENGKTSFFYSPLESSEITNFHTLNIVVQPAEDVNVPLSNETLAFVEENFDFNVTFDKEGFVNSGSKLPITITSIDPWTREPTPFANFDMKLIEEQYSSTAVSTVDNSYLQEKVPYFVVNNSPQDIFTRNSLNTNNQSTYTEELELPKSGIYTLLLTSGKGGQNYPHLIESIEVSKLPQHYLAKSPVNVAYSTASVTDEGTFELLITAPEDLNGLVIVKGGEIYLSEPLKMKKDEVISKKIELGETTNKNVDVCVLGIAQGVNTYGWSGGCDIVKVN